MITQWNDTEDDLLQGLPLRAQIIYLRGLRRYMNYKTGVVGGVERRISLTMLGEIACEEFNRKLQSPTKDAVRSSLEQLKRIGLIERVEDKDYLIFFLPKATVNNSVQNNNPTTTPQQPHNNPTHNTTPEPSNVNGFIGEQRTAQNGAFLEGALTTPHIRITDIRSQEDIKGVNPFVGKKKVTANYSDEFESAWGHYPRRYGDNPKSKAFRAWNARLAEGALAQTMIDGVIRYRSWCETTGKIGTEKVKHAATFFGPDKCFLDDWAISAPNISSFPSRQSKAEQIQQQNNDVFQRFLQG